MIYCGMFFDDELTTRKPGFDDQVTSRRLGSILIRHRSGDRSSDRFSLKVCDCLVLPELSEVDFQNACQNDYMFDYLTQKFIRDNLSFCFVATGTVTKAERVLGEIYAGSLGFVPILTPIKE